MKNIILNKYISTRLILFSFAIFLFSCNGDHEPKGSPSQKSDSTQTVSVDTFHLDTNEVTSDFKPYQDKNTLSHPNELLKQIKNGKTKVFFHGIVTEPFLDIYLTDSELLYIDNGSVIQETYKLISKFDKNLKSQTIIYENESGIRRKLEIKKEPSGDGMSDRIYPYRLFIDDWHGGGDCKRMVDWSEYEK